MAAIAALVLLTGCAHPRTQPTFRPFDFHTDTFAYPNELAWIYSYDAQGNWTTQGRDPKPEYSLHCFVVAKCARQFYDHARFDITLPRADDRAYARMIRRVARANPRKPSAESDKVVIPGFGSLHEFSQAKEHLLKAECGGAWQSYFQRGHWRMIFPFSRKHQERTADALLAKLKRNRPPIVHVVTFPSLGINHALLVYEGRPRATEVEFIAYDPNEPNQPLPIKYDRGTRTFTLPPLKYFRGGPVDVYEVYYSWNY